MPPATDRNAVARDACPLRSGVVAGRATRATAVLDAAGVPYRLHPYSAPGRDAYGAEAADALGLAHERVFKTLVADVDGHGPVLAVVPVSGRLDLKALAAACGGKRATMTAPADAQRLTGYVVGGIAPLGSQRPVPVLVDLSAAAFDTVYCSAGRRGLQLEIAPDDLVTVAGAELAELAT